MWISRVSSTNNKRSYKNDGVNSPGEDSTATTSATSTTTATTILNDDGDDDDESIDLLAPLPTTVSTETKTGSNNTNGQLSYQQQQVNFSPASQTLNMLDAFNNNTTNSDLFLSQTDLQTFSKNNNNNNSSSINDGIQIIASKEENDSISTNNGTTIVEPDLSVNCFCRNKTIQSGEEGLHHHSMCKRHPDYDSYILDLTRSGAFKGCPACKSLLQYDTCGKLFHLQTCRRNVHFGRKEKALTKKIQQVFITTATAASVSTSTSTATATATTRTLDAIAAASTSTATTRTLAMMKEGVSNTNKSPIPVTGEKSQNYDYHDSTDSDDDKCSYDDANNAMSLLFKKSSHIKAGIKAGCTRCMELSSRGTSSVKHGRHCPSSSRTMEGIALPHAKKSVHDTTTYSQKESFSDDDDDDNDDENSVPSNLKCLSETSEQQEPVPTSFIGASPTDMSTTTSVITHHDHHQPLSEFVNSSNLLHSRPLGDYTTSIIKRRQNDSETTSRNIPSNSRQFGNNVAYSKEGFSLQNKQRSFLSQTSMSQQEEQRYQQFFPTRPRIAAPIPGDSINNNVEPSSRWIACGNPWGPSGYLEGDAVLSFSNGSSYCTNMPPPHPLLDGLILPLLRFAQEPFSIPSYLKTHRGGSDSRYSVLCLRRDAFALLCWGFVTCLHEFGGACLVKEVTPCSSADAAVDVGNSHMEDDQPSGEGGLRINDMIVCINGKVVGGMSELEFLTEMDISGPTMLLVVARCFDMNLHRSTVRNLAEREMSHWAFNEPLHWTEFGSSGNMQHSQGDHVDVSYTHWSSGGTALHSDHHFDLNRSNKQPLIHRTFSSGPKDNTDILLASSAVADSQMHNIVEEIAEHDSENKTRKQSATESNSSKEYNFSNSKGSNEKTPKNTQQVNRVLGVLQQNKILQRGRQSSVKEDSSAECIRITSTANALHHRSSAGSTSNTTDKHFLPEKRGRTSIDETSQINSLSNSKERQKMTPKKVKTVNPALAVKANSNLHKECGVSTSSTCHGFATGSYKSKTGVLDEKKRKAEADRVPVASTSQKVDWKHRYNELIVYKTTHGDCLVPSHYEPNAQLGNWVKLQRSNYQLYKEGKRSIMTSARIEMMESIGFKWAIYGCSGNRTNGDPELHSTELYDSHADVERAKKAEASRASVASTSLKVDWMDRYNELIVYKTTHGDCLVPWNYKPNPQLANWVANQRKIYRVYKEGKRSYMTSARIDMLESIGFKWATRGYGGNCPTGDPELHSTELYDSHADVEKFEGIENIDQEDCVDMSLYGGEEPWLSCICGKTHPEPMPVFWIQCDGCNAWYNVSPKCIGFDRNQAILVGGWNCLTCINNLCDEASQNSSSSLCDPDYTSTKIVTEPRQQQNEAKTENYERIFQVGELVVVTYNLSGDVGKVTHVHMDHDDNGEEEVSYDIRYILGGGSEKNVEAGWVTPHENSSFACDGTRNSKRSTTVRSLPDKTNRMEEHVEQSFMTENKGSRNSDGTFSQRERPPKQKLGVEPQSQHPHVAKSKEELTHTQTQKPNQTQSKQWSRNYKSTLTAEEIRSQHMQAKEVGLPATWFLKRYKHSKVVAYSPQGASFNSIKAALNSVHQSVVSK